MNEILHTIINASKSGDKNSSKVIQAFVIDRIGFKDAHDLQDKLQEARINNEINDIFLIVEHNPVYTITKHTDLSHLLFNETMLKDKGIETASVDRGGDITYHGPGQIVGYPIINIKNHKLTVKTYVEAIENTLIEALKTFGIEGYIDPNAHGVWVNSRKIAALGIRISKYVTKHGFALNNSTDLSHFQGIIPCGLTKPVTSIQAELNKEISKEIVIESIIQSMQTVFNTDVKLVQTPGCC